MLLHTNHQRSIMAEYECVFEMIYRVLRAVGRNCTGFFYTSLMHSSAALQRLSSANNVLRSATEPKIGEA
jgi:hypothetical protein